MIKSFFDSFLRLCPLGTWSFLLCCLRLWFSSSIFTSFLFSTLHRIFRQLSMYAPAISIINTDKSKTKSKCETYWCFVRLPFGFTRCLFLSVLVLISWVGGFLSLTIFLIRIKGKTIQCPFSHENNRCQAKNSCIIFLSFW